MADPFTTTLSSINAGLALLKAVRSADNAYASAEIKAKFAELADQLVDAKTASLEGKELLQAKDQEIAALKKALELSGEVSKFGDAYFRRGDKDPLCVRCWEVDNRLLHIVRRDRGTYTCTKCLTAYEGLSIGFNDAKGFTGNG